MFFIFYYKKVIHNLSPKLSTTFSFKNVVDKSYPQIVDNFGDNTKKHSQTLGFTTNFFLWILWISTCVWWITLWITCSVFTYKQSYPHYPQFYMPYPLLSYPHSIHSFFPLIHMLSTILSTFYPNVVDIFYRLLSSSLLKFFIIFSIISLYGLIGSFLENYHIPTSGVTND